MKQQLEFLAKKSQMAAMLAEAKTLEEIQAIISKFTPGTSSEKPESKDSEDLSINLDEDEDELFFGNFG